MNKYYLDDRILKEEEVLYYIRRNYKLILLGVIDNVWIYELIKSY